MDVFEFYSTPFCEYQTTVLPADYRNSEECWDGQGRLDIDTNADYQCRQGKYQTPGQLPRMHPF
jgi:hypothetical protein